VGEIDLWPRPGEPLTHDDIRRGRLAYALMILAVSDLYSGDHERLLAWAGNLEAKVEQLRGFGVSDDEIEASDDWLRQQGLLKP
jgi:hypothetical protein